MPNFRPEYIVVHTAAFAGKNCDRDLIDKWHRDRGWNGIGYHYVIINDKHERLRDGTVQEGRALGSAGAHVEGLNQRSIGICCAGHGDVDPFTAAQQQSLIELISRLIDEYPEVTVDSIIGHREVNTLVAEGFVAAQFKTSKSCPGRLIDMAKIREQVRDYRLTGRFTPAVPGAARARRAPNVPKTEDVKKALDVLDRAAPTFPNAGHEINVLMSHPEIFALRGRRSARPDEGGGGRPGERGGEGRGDDGGDGRPDEGSATGRPDEGGGGGRPNE